MPRLTRINFTGCLRRMMPGLAVAARAVAIPVVALLMTGCPASDEPEPSPEPTPAAPGTRRTVIVYMASANSLGTPGWGMDETDMDEMKQWSAAGGDLNGCNVVTLHFSNETNPLPRMLRLIDGELQEVRVYDRLASGVYSTDPEVMRSMLEDVRRAFPADEYGLVLWSHGSAWTFSSSSSASTLAADPRQPSPAMWGDDRGHSMTIPELASVICHPSLAPWAFIYFDSCYAANVEMAWELQEASRWLIGSTTEIQADGMPYQLNLTNLVADVIDPALIARTTFEYYDVCTGWERSCTMTVIDTERLPALGDAMAALAAAGGKLPADYTPIPYYYQTTHHTYDFADWVHALAGVPPSLVDQWDKAFAAAVPWHASTPMMWEGYPGALDLSKYCGLGSYIPTGAALDTTLGYHRLRWTSEVLHNATF